MRSYFAPWLEDAQLRRWLGFAEEVPWAHYLQDPRWAAVEHSGHGIHARRPTFFWSERAGDICLTAIGVRRSLPVLGLAFWEFRKGPTFAEPETFDDWLAWLVPTMSRDAARLYVEPPMPLNEGGDDAETVLERHGFRRYRTMGTWSTLVVDVRRTEDDILASFRRDTRAAIRKAREHGIVVDCEDTPEGWEALCELQFEMAHRAPVGVVTIDTMACISRHWLAGGMGGTLLVARSGEAPLTAALVVKHRSTAYLRMLPSSPKRAKPSAAHLVVWEGIRWAKSRGCSSFDLDGYALMTRPDDPLSGVNQFKRGFAPLQEPLKATALHERVNSPALCGAVRLLQRVRRTHHGQGIGGQG
jgi:hypothetical protein